MRNSISRLNFALSLLVSIILFISLVLPNIAVAQGDSIESKPISAIKNISIENKVDSKLIKQFKDQDQITFILKFKEQADTNRVAKETAEKAKKQKLTEVNTKLQVRSAVVSSLRNTALETQTEVMEYLEEAKQKGEVKSVQSFYVVNAIAVTATKAVMDKLAAFPEVEKILPNETRQIITPIQPKVKTTNINSSTVEWGVERVGAPQVWDMGIDGAGIVVASIDTGVQWEHPALKEKYRGYNPANPNQPDHQLNWFDAVAGRETPYDDLKHGTHTVGTMVGSEPDGSNQIGVAPGAKWIAVKAFSDSGGMDVDLLEAGEWILAPKDAEGNPHPELAPDVVNNSWGGGPGLNEWYRPMVQNWRAANIFPVFAAGNDGFRGDGWIASPANYPESLSVAATDHDNALAWFSSRGPGPYGETKPDVSAPGFNIRSSIPTNDYELMSGTSMATPHITGVVALLKQANASLTNDQIEEILTSTAIPLTDSEFSSSPNFGYGHGFVNAYNAIKTLNNGNGMVKGIVVHDGKDKTNPTYQHTSPDFVYDQVVLPLTVEVQDNISVETVEIQYLAGQQWKTVKAARTAGDFRNGTYQAVVPGEDVKKGTFTYKWKMADYGQNQVTSPEFNVEVKPAITIGYFQDLEAVPEGWYSEGWNNDWEWGSPAAGPGQAYSGQKVYGTNLEGPHAPTADSYLNMPPIDIPENGNSYLQYKQWYDISPDGVGGSTDYGAVLVSTDRQNWEILTKTEATKFAENGVPLEYSTNGWVDAEVNLSAYAGKRIYISFFMFTLQTGFDFEPHDGWYLDDFSLTDKAITEDTKQDIFKKNTTNEIHIKKNSKNSVLAPNATSVQNTTSQPNVLPIGAQVTLLDSGYSVTANPADGRFSMTHKAGEFKLRAEAYGFHSKDQAVSIPKDGIVEANFNLQPLGKGTVEGVVKDQATGKPISDAIISLVEDAAITPVKTDSKGKFTLKAYEGTYTLHVFKNNYVYNDYSITLQSNKKTKQNIELKRFLGTPGEIGYDDGTSENSWIWNGAKNGFAIRMSLEEGVTKSWLTGGLFKVNTEWPKPGSTRFQVAVYDSTGVNGAPGKRIAGPFEAAARTDGEWTHVDLTDKNIFVTGDFYLVYVQPEAAATGTMPSLESDQNSPFHDRNWWLYNGTWQHVTTPEYGNMMIRAVMNNEISATVIKTPSR
ncbi:S8 family serine peptidase [Priestia megaterium]|uniref:S8 family serine peptidase n=1 Tax=Priestia megaterium TaxID=1404 RepID=A0A6H1P4J9_PRIMG|nr:S8 family serine peptidase [Priestia megaterium]QIZ08524.1 S8 family serine peptidase [Priestia megaterium]